MAAEGGRALEARLRELVASLGVGEGGGGQGEVVGREGRDAWAAWYERTFAEVEGRVAAVGAAADAAVRGMRGEVAEMRREVEVRGCWKGWDGWRGGWMCTQMEGRGVDG